jgi:hypothetical protein
LALDRAFIRSEVQGLSQIASELDLEELGTIDDMPVKGYIGGTAALHSR